MSLTTPPYYKAGPTPPHSTLVHVQVTECSTATDMHTCSWCTKRQPVSTDSWIQPADEWVGSDGPSTTHKHIIRTETAVCAHERGSGTRQHDSRHVMLAARTEGAAPNTIRPSTQPFTILWVYCQYTHSLPRPNASTTRSPPPSSQRPSLTRWSRVEL